MFLRKLNRPNGPLLQTRSLQRASIQNDSKHDTPTRPNHFCQVSPLIFVRLSLSCILTYTVVAAAAAAATTTTTITTCPRKISHNVFVVSSATTGPRI